MKICTAHWGKCRAAIVERGMEHLINPNSVRDEMRAWKRGGKPPFDPLAALGWMMYSWGVELMGLEIMFSRSPGDGMPENDGEYCPLCCAEVDFNRHNTPEGRCDNPECPIRVKPGTEPWDTGRITLVADQMFDMAKEKGLVTVQ